MLAATRLWTDAERAVEFRRVWRSGCLDLVLGKTSSPTLKLLSHPAADVGPDALRKEPWAPPGKGFVQADSFAFSLLDSIICDPGISQTPQSLPRPAPMVPLLSAVWHDKFPSLIDGRMTFHNESFFHLLRKWGTKHSHYHRFYALAIWSPAGPPCCPRPAVPTAVLLS